MARRLRAVLTAVFKASGRGSRTLRAASNNNMLYAGIALAAMTDVMALQLFVSIMAVVLFLPSSGDPMGKAPPDRLQLWPLRPQERVWLRLLSPFLNPLSWILLAAFFWKRIHWDLWLFVAAAFAAGFILPSLRAGNAPPRWTPTLPGPLRMLVRKDFRQVLFSLDLYCALLIAAPAFFFRLGGRLPETAGAPLTMLVLIILSTCAQTLFGLDGDAGMTRYRLLPLAGWRILFAKGAAYLFWILLVTLPLHPAAGLAGGLAALALGQFFALRARTPQLRWRFRASASFASSLGVMGAAILASGLVIQLGAPWILAAAALYAASLWHCGRLLDRAV